MSSYLLTGAGRGLGLELVKQLATKPTSEVAIVFATSRSGLSSALQSLIESSSGRVVHITMVLTEKQSIERAASEVDRMLGDKGLDVLINNAATKPSSPAGIQTMDNLMETLMVNVEAVHNITAAFLPLLKRGKERKVLNISSEVGSMNSAYKYSYGPYPAYKISKAALNMLTVQYSQEFAKEGVAFLLISPGWLETDMGTDRGEFKAELPVQVGASAVLSFLHRAGLDNGGKLYNINVPEWKEENSVNVYDGGQILW